MQKDRSENALIQSIIAALDKTLPAAFGRQAVDKLMPGVIASKTLANLQSQGIGPPCQKIGHKKSIYEKTSYLKWLEIYMREGSENY